MKYKKTLLTAIISITISILVYVLFFNTPNSQSSVNNLNFEFIEGNSFVDVRVNENPPENETQALTGKLVDTGVINMLFTYNFNGKTVDSTRYYLEDRIYDKGILNSELWVEMEGKISATEHGNRGNVYDKFATDKYTKIGTPDKNLLKTKCNEVNSSLDKIDLNSYKKTNRFQDHLNDTVGDKDLNSMPFEKSSKLVFIDEEKASAGVYCGKITLNQNAQIQDYLSFYAILNTDDLGIEKVIVVNTGEFLE